MEGGTKICMYGPGRIAKMAATPVFHMLMKLGMQLRGLEFYNVCIINDDAELTLTYCTARSNLVSVCFNREHHCKNIYWENRATNDQIDRRIMFLKTV